MDRIYLRTIVSRTLSVDKSGRYLLRTYRHSYNSLLRKVLSRNRYIFQYQGVVHLKLFTIQIDVVLLEFYVTIRAKRSHRRNLAMLFSIDPDVEEGVLCKVHGSVPHVHHTH